LYQALIALSDDVAKIHLDLYPILSAVTPIINAQLTPPPLPDTFTKNNGPFTVNFVWSPVVEAAQYELRQGGTNWDNATFVVKTPSFGASIDALVAGAYTFRLKTINIAGVYSENHLELSFTINVPSQPSPSITVIDNNVLLFWTPPTADFAIDHYEVYRDTTLLALLSGTFYQKYETVAGTYMYGIKAVDVAGNTSIKGEVQGVVSAPPDFTLFDDRVVNLSTMTLVNAVYEPDQIIACIDLTEQFEAHFNNRSWADPEDQVTAGYERWIQDNLLTGSATEAVYDYGLLLHNLIATVTYDVTTYSGTNAVNVTPQMRVSNDGVTWSDWQGGSSQFYVEYRYFQLRFVFDAPNDDAMIALSNVRVVLNVKRELDGNNIFCRASDVNGTLVQLPGDFSQGHGMKTFRDIDTITLDAKAETPITAIYDFLDVPDPTGFRIFCFDSAGQRADSLVSWKVKGIV